MHPDPEHRQIFSAAESARTDLTFPGKRTQTERHGVAPFQRKGGTRDLFRSEQVMVA